MCQPRRPGVFRADSPPVVGAIRASVRRRPGAMPGDPGRNGALPGDLRGAAAVIFAEGDEPPLVQACGRSFRHPRAKGVRAGLAAAPSGGPPGPGTMRQGRAQGPGPLGPAVDRRRLRRRIARRRLDHGRPGSDHGDQGRQVLGGRLAGDHPQSRPGCGRCRRWARPAAAGTHSGMFPCFFGGNVSRLPRNARSALITYERVWDGGITEST